MTNGPTPFEVHESGALFHGTKADLAVGDVLLPGRGSNFKDGRTSANSRTGWATRPIRSEPCSTAWPS
jgi:hypothetical protein